jgi:hypothetical protein
VHDKNLTSTTRPGKFLTRVFLALSKVLRFARLCHFGKDREAGENPALPRNCKRGTCSQSLGDAREGCLPQSDVAGSPRFYCDLDSSSLASQETGANRPPQTFRV